MFSLLCATALSAWPSIPFPSGTTLNTDTASDFSFAELAVNDDGKPLKVRGHRWRGYAQGNQSGPVLWDAWRPLLQKAGWKGTSDLDGHSLKKVDGTATWWLRVTTPEFDAPLLQILKVGGAPQKLDVLPPAPKVELVKDDQDYPYAPTFPGQERTGTGRAEVPFMTTEKVPRYVADAFAVKWYRAPPGLSRLEAVLSAADALRRAGWDVVVANEEDGIVQAHFAKNGRDVWLSVSHREDGTEQALTVGVVDLAAEDFERQLEGGCTLTLRGVTFEFNKAVLKPESELTLSRVAAALAARKTVKLEVSGHTDSSGSDAFNQKLSEGRATAVVAWLTSHGVLADRLTSRGSGETEPVGDNATDEGRAKNRRVDLTCR